MRTIKMAIGGAPISQMFADEIGADGYGADASNAVDLFLCLSARARAPAPAAAMPEGRAARNRRPGAPASSLRLHAAREGQVKLPDPVLAGPAVAGEGVGRLSRR